MMATLIRVISFTVTIVLFALVSALVNPPSAEERATVIWRTTDWPPFYIRTGPNAGHGLYDIMIKEYQKALPEFDHELISMTTMRALQQMKHRQKGLAVCHVSMLRRSLTGFAHVSELNSLLPAYVIFAHRDAAASILALSESGDNYVSVEKLFLADGLSGAHTSFGTHAVLEKYQYEEVPRTNVTMTAENYKNLKDLFVNKRVDFIVQYPEFYGTLLEAGLAAHQIAIIEIAETRNDPVVKVYVGCTKNEVGAAAIERVNAILAQKPRSLQDARLFGLSPQGRAQLKSLYETIAPELNDY